MPDEHDDYEHHRDIATEVLRHQPGAGLATDANTIAAAQVHATLALAAATRENAWTAPLAVRPIGQAPDALTETAWRDLHVGQAPQDPEEPAEASGRDLDALRQALADYRRARDRFATMVPSFAVPVQLAAGAELHAAVARFFESFDG